MPLLHYPEFFQESLKTPKHSIIHVKNLSGNARVGVDVWGRTENGRVNKFQPIQISASISLEEPFETAARSDSVDRSTVHYGTLSKEILKVLAYRGEALLRPNESEQDPDCLECIQSDWTLAVLLDAIHSWIAGRIFSWDYYGGTGEVYNKCSTLLANSSNAPGNSIIGTGHEVELSCFLPKGSILGSGVSLRVLTMPHPNGPAYTICSILKLHDLRIPTLIGVNANERLAKQMVIANVEIDGYLVTDFDLYHKLEQIVVKTIEESSFDTLESLGSHLIKRIIKWFIYSEFDSFSTPNTLVLDNAAHRDDSKRKFDQIITVSLEKPSAVMFAESPVIEIRRHADPEAYSLGIGLELNKEIFELGRRMNEDIRTVAKVPFPLQGRLDNWIRAKDPNDTT